MNKSEREIIMEIKITKTTTPNSMPPEDQLGFGKVFTDHMLLVDWEEGKGWFDARILPFYITARKFSKA